MMTAERICSVHGCCRKHDSNGYCGMHAARARRGKPLGEPGYQRDPRRTTEERVFSRLRQEPRTGCWEWTGAKRAGYGLFGIGQRLVYVHRWTYEFLRSEIPSGLVIDHHCLNPACCNPWHLEPVSRAENARRGGPLNGRKAVTA